jgi:hypothetical protein
MRGSLLPDRLRKRQEHISKVIIDSTKSKIEGPDLAWLHRAKLELLQAQPEVALQAAQR